MKTISTFLIITCILSLPVEDVFSQAEQDCGTIVTPENIAYRDSMRVIKEQFRYLRGSSATIYVPVQFHIINQSDGTGVLAQDTIPFMLEYMNASFDFPPQNLVFYQCHEPNIINVTGFFDFNTGDEGLLCDTRDVENVLNIYIPNSITKEDGGTVGGYARVPPSEDRAFFQRGLALSSTVPHEIGHYFSLYHTHSVTTDINCGYSLELVDGSNCLTEGDEICDTPADPNLSYGTDTDGNPDCSGNWVDNNCNYTGSFIDALGNSYTPLTNNIMSYSRRVCRTNFTPGQFFEIILSALNDRANLECPDCPPIKNVSTHPGISAISYKAGIELSSDLDFGSNHFLTQFTAGSRVELSTGFKIHPGTYFKAEIGPCD